MSDVKVPQTTDNAVLLLEAAAKGGHRPNVVRTTTDGYFLVPEEVAKSAEVDVLDEGPSDKEPARAAKKTTPRKRAAKKTKE